MATYDLREWVVGSSRDWPSTVNEFDALAIPSLPSVHVKPLRVAGSPVQFECKLTQKLLIPGNTPEATAWLLVAQVVGIHIDDAALTPNGEIDVLRFKPLARMGYRDYTCVERVFQLNEFTGREAHGIAHLQESVHV